MMTKTLTEQWLDGELFGFHYVKEPKEEPKIHNVSEMDYLLDEYGVEVLERVPSYGEIKRLQEQLKEANNIIIQYCFYEYGKPYLKKWGVK